MKNKNIYNDLVARRDSDCEMVDAIIDVDVLPYPAKFVADPFIHFFDDCYHILCEVFVSGSDKRIAHIFSKNGLNWHFCADVIVGESISFPAFYQFGTDGDVVIIPQLGGRSSFKLKTYKYNLSTGGQCHEVSSILLDVRMKDRLLLSRNDNANFLIYGNSVKSRGTLSIVPVEGSIESNVFIGKDSDRVDICSRSLGELLKNKLLRKPKLTHRPAGNILATDETSFIIPIQATIRGMYGECLAFLEIRWDSFDVLGVDFLYPHQIEPSFRRTHHLSWTINRKKEIVFCGDFIDNDIGNWKLYISLPKEGKGHVDNIT